MPNKKWMTRLIWLEHVCTLPSATRLNTDMHMHRGNKCIICITRHQRTHYYNCKVDRNTSSRRPGWFLAWCSIHHTCVRLTQPFQTPISSAHSCARCSHTNLTQNKYAMQDRKDGVAISDGCCRRHARRARPHTTLIMTHADSINRHCISYRHCTSHSRSCVRHVD